MDGTGRYIGLRIDLLASERKCPQLYTTRCYCMSDYVQKLEATAMSECFQLPFCRSVTDKWAIGNITCCGQACDIVRIYITLFHRQKNGSQKNKKMKNEIQ